MPTAPLAEVPLHEADRPAGLATAVRQPVGGIGIRFAATADGVVGNGLERLSIERVVDVRVFVIGHVVLLDG